MTSIAGLPDRADVVVVGAGIAGASAGWALSEQATVVVIEQEEVAGHHATGRSASVLSETSGRLEVCRLVSASRPFFEHPPAGFAETALLSRRGLWWVGRAGEAAALDEVAERGRLVSPTVQRCDRAATVERLPGIRPEAVAAGSVAEPGAMAIDTAALLQAYVGGVRRRGGVVATSAAMRSCRRVGGAWEVQTTAGVVRAAHLIDAAGAWADVVAERAGVVPLGFTAMRRTAALASAPVQAASWPLVMDVAGRWYAEPEAGGLLISPADETPSPPLDARPEEVDVAWALDQLNQATTFELRSVRRAWAGLRTFAPDRLPVVGEDPDAPGFWWLAGQGGAGIKTAPALAELVAAAVFQRPVADVGLDPAALAPERLRG